MAKKPAATIEKVDPELALRAARAALAKGDLATASRQLVAAWVSVPSPWIASLAVRASKRLPVRALPSQVAAREAKWIELAATHDSDVLPTLLALDWPVHPRGAKARLAELVKFAPDPRIAESLLALWHAGRFRSNASNTFWKTAFKTIAAWGDPRPRELLEADRGYLLSWIFGTDKLPNKVALATPLERELAAIDAAIDQAEPAPVSRDALFAAVYAEPDADEPRAVLGDALLADGDPRGEFIQLQLGAVTAKTQTRIRALLREHAASWSTAFADTWQPGFRRGFVNAVRCRQLPSDAELARPEWRAIEELELVDDPPPADELARALALPGLATVRRLAVFTWASLTKLDAPRTFERIEAYTPLAPLPKAMRVRELAVLGRFNQPLSLAETFAWLDTLPNQDAVRLLELGCSIDHVVELASWLRLRAPATLERVTIGDGLSIPRMWRVELTRAGGGLAVIATWHGRVLYNETHEGLGRVIAELPRGTVAAFTALTAVKLEPDVRATLERDIAVGATAHGLAASTIRSR